MKLVLTVHCDNAEFDRNDVGDHVNGAKVAEIVADLASLIALERPRFIRGSGVFLADGYGNVLAEAKME